MPSLNSTGHARSSLMAAGRLALRFISVGIARSESTHKTLMLMGAIYSELNKSKSSIQSIADVEFSVYSQWGEDGIIDWIINKLPEAPRSFVEFGVQDYQESNTRFLLRQRNWRGLVFDGSARNIQAIQRDPISWQHQLHAQEAFIDRSNINEILTAAGFTGDIGILSIDVDGNDYWILDKIETVSPWLLIVEYNAVFGDVHNITVPYAASFRRTDAHSSNLYFGASIGAITKLATSRGYECLGTNSAGNNAFFVRRDLYHRFEPIIGEREPRPSLFREGRSPTGSLTLQGGKDRIKPILSLRVTDVDSGTDRVLGDLDPIYSPSWLAKMGG